ncbi:type IV-A pilus assembly ATPase PilB [Vibrio brasiliensis]|uniref:type IV-A pilus assembly ATPase PilB n=1 Tax=Vibrio brasiliensis TaxID=170652 RepID=UPI001EFE67EA|nr:type IV-A pilus assembly ATPase PilB [Vibrio brasiliensis]MCG9650291.1 type IV-A pilus assembly ATPase PilB [Vibrio brasiliensis]
MVTSLPSILHQADLLTTSQKAQLVEHVKVSGQSVPEALLTLELLTSSQLTQHLSQLFALPETSVDRFDYAALCNALGLRELITRYTALPIMQTQRVLTVAVTDLTDTNIEEEFRFATGLQVELALADFHKLQGAIRRVYGKSVTHGTYSREISEQDLAALVNISEEELSSVEDLAQDDAPVSRYINQILQDAVRKCASDIHFEPYEQSYRVRMRCDGLLVESQQPPHHLSRRLATRLKILSKLDIAERRLPQDGRIKLKIDPQTAIDIRVSTLPTLWGEKVVVRMLDSRSAPLDLEALGYSVQQKQLYLNALKKPQGLIIVTGPTGSGKSASLYTGLKILNTTQINIATAEDPVEINLTGVNQVQVLPHIGLDFTRALRAFLRQDPDIIMVGEVRDAETAEIAVKAAQTGHLVLTTLHTNSAAEAVTRLKNMGIEAYNLSSSLSLVIAQRLVRRLCPNCKLRFVAPPAVQQQFCLPDQCSLFEANPDGCNECNNGYAGRIGLYELMEFSQPLIEAVNQGRSSLEIEHIARQQGMMTLKQAGVEKLISGITSYQELMRVLY